MIFTFYNLEKARIISSVSSLLHPYYVVSSAVKVNKEIYFGRLFLYRKFRGKNYVPSVER